MKQYCWTITLGLLAETSRAFAPVELSSRTVKSTVLFNHGPKLGAGGMADTRDPDALVHDDPRKSIGVAPSFEEYLKQRNGANGAATATATTVAPPPPPSTPPPPPVAPAVPVSVTKPASYAPGGGRPYNMGSGSGMANYLDQVSPAVSAPTHSAPATIMANNVNGAVDYNAVREELKLLMDNPSWDDGSLAPILIRLAWHSSGTYDQATGSGGSNGAGMRFATEAADPENAGLEVARAFLEPVKAKFPAISYSDLWILAAYVGLEHTGGPVIPFTPGRMDHVDESYWAATGMTYGRLPAAEKYSCPYVDGEMVGDSLDSSGKVIGWEGLCSHVRYEVFGRMGFNDQEIVALLCGGHVYGRCHPNFSGYAGPWVEHPTQFSNEYATDMLEDEWTLVSHSDTWLDAQGAAELRPAPGNRQFVNKKYGEIDDDEPNQMMLLSDMILAWDPAFRTQLEVYAADEARLKDDFGKAFKKLTELGCGFQ